MSSSKILEIARRAVKEDKHMFDALLEYEKTGKIRTKERLNFTIDKGIANTFRKYCREHGYNMSAKVEEALNKMTEGKKK
jgi:putative hemolysin